MSKKQEEIICPVCDITVPESRICGKCGMGVPKSISYHGIYYQGRPYTGRDESLMGTVMGPGRFADWSIFK